MSVLIFLISGCFLDLLLEKVELMSSNSLSTNLLVTSILSHLASFPQPLLRSVLLQPDLVFQPSVRGLFTAVASIRQKLDNIMPTLTGSEEAIVEARRFLCQRAAATEGSGTAAWGQSHSRRESVASTISHIGEESETDEMTTN